MADSSDPQLTTLKGEEVAQRFPHRPEIWSEYLPANAITPHPLANIDHRYGPVRLQGQRTFDQPGYIDAAEVFSVSFRDVKEYRVDTATQTAAPRLCKESLTDVLLIVHHHTGYVPESRKVVWLRGGRREIPGTGITVKGYERLEQVLQECEASEMRSGGVAVD